MAQASPVRSSSAWLPALLLALAAPAAAAQGVPPAAPERATAPAGAPEAAARKSVGAFLGAPPELVERLTSEQVHDLLERQLEAERHRNDPPWIAGVVPVAFFAAVFFGLWVGLQHRARQEAKRHETMRAMIEKGLEVPRELLAPPRARGPESPVLRDLRRGLLLVCGGLGLSACCGMIGIWNEQALRAAGLGLVPLFLGFGYLVVWKLGRKADRQE
ncbi:MAG: hypothetical protein JXB32_09205 [Deltaproteobacteria bacterium]|nr:hypothetical protein [Deltaproteobacteria bacterium]